MEPARLPLRGPKRPENPEKRKVRDAVNRWLLRPTDPERVQALHAALDDFELIFRLWQRIPRAQPKAPLSAPLFES